jgi:hypothetical protein
MLRICGIFLLWTLSGCYAQQPAPEAPPAQSSEQALIIEGYRDGNERREMQALLATLGLELETLNSGAGRAEYRIQTQPADAWHERLKNTLPPGWQLRHSEDRVYLIRTP